MAEEKTTNKNRRKESRILTEKRKLNFLSDTEYIRVRETYTQVPA
jgi:hypothetical protein